MFNDFIPTHTISGIYVHIDLYVALKNIIFVKRILCNFILYDLRFSSRCQQIFAFSYVTFCKVVLTLGANLSTELAVSIKTVLSTETLLPVFKPE